MSLRRHLIKGLGLAQKIALAVSVFVMAVALPVIAKADVISTPRIGRPSSLLSMGAVSILIAVVGVIMIIKRRR